MYKSVTDSGCGEEATAGREAIHMLFEFLNLFIC